MPLLCEQREPALMEARNTGVANDHIRISLAGKDAELLGALREDERQSVNSQLVRECGVRGDNKLSVSF